MLTIFQTLCFTCISSFIFKNIYEGFFLLNPFYRWGKTTCLKSQLICWEVKIKTQAIWSRTFTQYNCIEIQSNDKVIIASYKMVWLLVFYYYIINNPKIYWLKGITIFIAIYSILQVCKQGWAQLGGSSGGLAGHLSLDAFAGTSRWEARWTGPFSPRSLRPTSPGGSSSSIDILLTCCSELPKKLTWKLPKFLKAWVIWPHSIGQSKSQDSQLPGEQTAQCVDTRSMVHWGHEHDVTAVHGEGIPVTRQHIYRRSFSNG